MRDVDKTKAQLINELKEMHRRVAELEKSDSERNKVEEELRKSEEQYKNIIELLTDGYLRVSLRGKITDCNSAFLNHTGYTREDVVNKYFTKLPTLQTKDIPQYIKMFNSAIRGRFQKPIEYEWIHRDGMTRWGEAYFGITKKRSRISGFSVITRDITERKQAEGALRESEEKYRSLVESTADSVYVVDRDCRYIFMNKENLSRLGLLLDKIVGKTYGEFHSKEESEKFRKMVNEVFRTGKSKTYEYRNQRDGNYFMRTYSPIIGLDGKPLSVTVVSKDISELKKAEEAMWTSEKHYRELVEKGGIAILIDDWEGKIQYCNIILARMFGHSIEEMKKQSIRSMIHLDDVDRVLKLHKYRMQGKKPPSRYDFKGIKKDGSVIYIEVSAVALEEDGKIIGSRSYLWDITERKRAEKEKENLQAQLIHSEKMAGIGTLTSGIAHEFNNMLQIMRGHAEFASRTDKPEDMKQALGIVEKTSDRVGKIIGDLLSFSRNEILEKELCDITVPLETVLSLIEEQIRKHNIEIVRKYKRVPKIEMDKAEIQQVFLNMATNARDAMLPEGGKLEIEVRQAEDYVKVSFHDTGKGIDKKNLDRVFEPFYTTKGAIGGNETIIGTGLGLSVSYGIVRRHSGTTEVESKKGKGTTFTVSLPVKDAWIKKKSTK